MRAKEYLKNRQKAMHYYNEVEQIVNDLYKIRHDKEATIEYYERVLLSDDRYQKHIEWESLHARYGALEREPVFVKFEGEVEQEDADNIREQLLKVVENDDTFKYITCLLLKQSNCEFSKGVELAIIEELTERLSVAETRILELEKQHKGKDTNEFNIQKTTLGSDVFLSENKGVKIDYIRIIDSLYGLAFFTDKNKNKPTKKNVFSAFGIAVNKDFSDYDKDLSRSLSDSTKLEKHLKIFDSMKEMMTKTFNSK